ncbi:MAG: hypothetical protein EBE86_025285 [Hormoscilla sp. GUM202]|nr:hypothetical protein [Hormoscilla sp. GUM202]
MAKAQLLLTTPLLIALVTAEINVHKYTNKAMNLFKFVKQLLVAGLLSLLITSVIPVAKAYAFDCEPVGNLCSVVVSEPGPQSGQKWRSSDNFSTSLCEGTRMQWHIEQTDEADQIIFDVALDKSGSDPTIFQGLVNCSITELIKDPKMYIGNPRNATKNFQVITYTQ